MTKFELTNPGDEVLVNYMSDLHFEFAQVMPEQANKVIPTGDVMVLAGDIFPIKWLPKAKHLSHFLRTCAERHGRVYAVAGNHEAYGRSLDDLESLRGFYADHGITYLDDEYDDFMGMRFFGGVLWPDMNNDDFTTKLAVRNYLNDYRVIEGMTPDEAVRRHKITMDKLKACRPNVVITHMAPNKGSIHPRFAHEGLANYGYYSDVDIPECVDVWIHGHVHDPFDYMVGNTNILTNPRGYPAETRRNGFRWDAGIVIMSDLSRAG